MIEAFDVSHNAPSKVLNDTAVLSESHHVV
jgi:hypothetical protein